MRLARPVGDITQGVIWKQLLTLFVPLWFGTFFQQLYNTVDTVVVPVGLNFPPPTPDTRPTL